MNITYGIYYNGMNHSFETEEQMEVFLQYIEEKKIVEKLGEDYFKIDKSEFIEAPKTAKEYREWRKTNK